jgi:hypothetical protein
MRILCVMTLVMVGFAHKPLAEAPLALQFAAYVLPDGSLPTLCLNEDPSKPAKMGDHGCDACRLAAAVLVPVPPQIGALAISYSYAAPFVGRRTYLSQRLYPPSSGPRAPPPTVMIS